MAHSSSRGVAALPNPDLKRYEYNKDIHITKKD